MTKSLQYLFAVTTLGIGCHIFFGVFSLTASNACFKFKFLFLFRAAEDLKLCFCDYFHSIIQENSVDTDKVELYTKIKLTICCLPLHKRFGLYVMPIFAISFVPFHIMVQVPICSLLVTKFDI